MEEQQGGACTPRQRAVLEMGSGHQYLFARDLHSEINLELPPA